MVPFLPFFLLSLFTTILYILLVVSLVVLFLVLATLIVGTIGSQIVDFPFPRIDLEFVFLSYLVFLFYSFFSFFFFFTFSSFFAFCLETTRVELVAPCMQRKCTTNCATFPF